jgi:hypothetical protein
MSNQKKGVYLAILNQGEIRAELAKVLLELTHQNKYNIMISYPADKPISHNRNKIVQDFLNHKDYDYLLMLDDDNVPPTNILNLADFDKDVICGISFGWQKNLVIPSVFKRKEDGLYCVHEFTGDEGLIETDAAGSGQMMIARRVLEKIQYPFRNEYDRDGIKKLGLDLNFCQRVKDLGFKIYVHTDYICSHFVTFDLKQIYQILMEKKEIENALAEMQKKDVVIHT